MSQNQEQIVNETKDNISKVLRATLEENDTSIRSLAHSIGMQHPQVIRITSCENYTINSLVRILDAAGLKITVEKK